ncbi:MAG: ribosomal RNA small subunit methyltransferase A [Desulfomonile tiedjei]|nr:ribosomal RNA small subunit methyltransferase A [Desulfomonile tiedjei]
MPKPAEIKRILKDHGLAPKKWMGQNFLVDPSYLRKIVAASGVQRGDSVVEVGAGLGALTETLVEWGVRVWALEVDAGFFRVLEEKFAFTDQVQLVHADALRYDFQGLAKTIGRLKVVANLPYSISSRLLFRIHENRDIFSSLHILLQREVAERLVAEPGTKDYGILSVFLAVNAEVDILFHIPARAFFPAPDIVSSLVRVSFLKEPIVAVPDRGLLTNLVRSSFAERRKTLRNTLRARPIPGVTMEAVLKAAEEAEIDLARRGETLSPEEFARFAAAVHAHASEG